MIGPRLLVWVIAVDLDQTLALILIRPFTAVGRPQPGDIVQGRVGYAIRHVAPIALPYISPLAELGAAHWVATVEIDGRYLFAEDATIEHDFTVHFNPEPAPSMMQPNRSIAG